MTDRGHPPAHQDRSAGSSHNIQRHRRRWRNELRACRRRWTPADATNCCWKRSRHGFSDRQLANLWDIDRDAKFAACARAAASMPVFKLVDTCAAEFEAFTPYYYSTYEVADRAGRPSEQASTATHRGRDETRPPAARNAS